MTNRTIGRKEKALLWTRRRAGGLTRLSGGGARALGVSLKREPLLPAVNEVEQRGGVYRPRHNGVIVTSGRGVVGGMAVGLVRDHNAGECQRGPH